MKLALDMLLPGAADFCKAFDLEGEPTGNGTWSVSHKGTKTGTYSATVYTPKGDVARLVLKYDGCLPAINGVKGFRINPATDCPGTTLVYEVIIPEKDLKEASTSTWHGLDKLLSGTEGVRLDVHSIDFPSSNTRPTWFPPDEAYGDKKLP